MSNNFSTIPEAITHIKKGNMLIIIDNPSRENEGDFYVPADTASIKHIMTMLRKGGGLLCCAVTQDLAYRLSLPLLVKKEENTEKTKVNFTIPVNAKQGIRSGISAYDRLKTIKTLINPSTKLDDLVKPGHVFGLVAKAGGVLARNGHTEAAVDLARLAHFTPAGVLCEIIRDDGRMAKMADLLKLAQETESKIISINDLMQFVKNNPPSANSTMPGTGQYLAKSVVRTASSILPTKYGYFRIVIYTSLETQREHITLVIGDVADQKPLVRVHSQCLTGESFSSLTCDCYEQLHKSMEIISKEGKGVIVYLSQEGRGIGLTQKIKAYAMQEKGLDTVEANQALGLPADARDYADAADILHDLGVSRIALLTNNPDKLNQLEKYGIHIIKRISLEIKPQKYNKKYLSAKKRKLGHYLTHV